MVKERSNNNKNWKVAVLPSTPSRCIVSNNNKNWKYYPLIHHCVEYYCLVITIRIESSKGININDFVTILSNNNKNWKLSTFIWNSAVRFSLVITIRIESKPRSSKLHGVPLRWSNNNKNWKISLWHQARRQTA